MCKKHLFFIFQIPIFIIVVCFTSYETYLAICSKKSEYLEIKDNAQYGDLILSRSIEWQSMVTSIFTGDEYSHIGFIITHGNNKYVLHASPDHEQYIP